MSGFNTIKKSRKRSHEIEEKLNVLNRELEKTKDIQEQPTMSTGDLYTPVVATLPQDPVQVDNPDPDPSTGATTDNWTQPVGDGEDGGTAGSIPSSFPRIVSNPGYQDPTSGWYGANGEPLYSEDDLEYDIPDASETGDLKALGGVQREKGGGDPGVINGYLRRDVAKDNFVDVGNTGANIGGVTFKTHPHLFKPINYWVSFSIFNPFIDAYFPNNPQGNTPQYTGVVAGSVDSNPRALFTAYKYVGGARTQTFDPEGDRGTTTAGDSKGTGDADQYPPIPWFERLGREGFKVALEAALGLNPVTKVGRELLRALANNPNANYKFGIAESIMKNEPLVFENKDIPESQKEDLIKNMDWYEVGNKIKVNQKQQTYSDENMYVDPVTKKMTKHTETTKKKYPPNTNKHTGNQKNPLSQAGEFQFQLVTPKNGEAYFAYEDHAYNNPESKDEGEVPRSGPFDLTPEFAKAFQFIGRQLPGYSNGIKGDLVKKVKIPISDAVKYDPRIKKSKWFQELNLNENAYMALLHREPRSKKTDILDQDEIVVNEYSKLFPQKIQYIIKRYPKSDPRLSMLNYRMDRMTEASDKYLETQFPTNQTLFTKVKERTRKNMNLTDPKNFKPVKDPIKYVDVKKTKKLKETVTRHFNKPVKSKSMFGLNMGKVRKTNQKMIEKREQEQRMKEEEKAYIQEKMSRQKSNWKDDLTEV